LYTGRAQPVITQPVHYYYYYYYYYYYNRNSLEAPLIKPAQKINTTQKQTTKTQILITKDKQTKQENKTSVKNIIIKIKY
jgi:hypothetical protein